MKPLALTLLLSVGLCAAPMQPLKLEELVREPGLTGPAPSQLAWSPDGSTLSYILPETGDAERRNLWAVDAKTGERRILVSHDQLTRLAPAVEKATDYERERERRNRYSVASYLWAPDSTHLLFVSSGRLYLYDLAAERPRAVAPEKTGVGDPRFSPDGRWISFIHNHDLWLAPTSGGEAQQLTRDGSAEVLHGGLDWIYPEEFGLRSGYAWSPDSRRIAFYEIDQRPVPEHPIKTMSGWRTKLDMQRYPYAGDPNPKVRIGVVEARPSRSGETVWLQVGSPEYIPRIGWANSKTVAVQTLDRSQRDWRLLLADTVHGRAHQAFAFVDPHWTNIGDDLFFLKSGGLVRTSEEFGLRHIERRDANGALAARLTEGEWEVQRVAAVDEDDGGWIYYLSNESNPIGADLFRVRLDGSGKQRLTDGRGTHAAEISPTHNAFADTFSTLTDPGGLDLARLDAESRFEIHRANSVAEYELVEAELSTIQTDDGATIRLHVLKPADIEPDKKLPLLLYVYGGPHAPTIRDAFDAGRARGMFHQYLAQKGYVVAQVDDRASSIRGHKYEAALHRDYGPVALRDHEAAVEHLTKLPYVDPDRVGIWGWSGGGFSTCYALTHSERFKAGAAVASVTDWRLYDSIYTERYMGLPEDEPEAYQRTSCVEAAGDLSGRLLLVHGTADDNVHVENTLKMADALIEAGRPYELQLYPGKTHGIAGDEARLHLYKLLEAFFDRWL